MVNRLASIRTIPYFLILATFAVFTDFSWYDYHFEVSVHLVRLEGAPGYRSLRRHFRTYRRFAKMDADRKIDLF